MVHRRLKPEGQARRYSVLVGVIKDGKEDSPGASGSPHYDIWVEAGGVDYRIAVNVRSGDGSDVLAYYNPTYQTPAGLDLGVFAKTSGLTFLKTGPNGEGLDYLRDGLFPINEMQDIPSDTSNFSLANLLDAQIERAKADQQAVVIAFGESFQDPKPDFAFGFLPERGVHDIHMMQGNSGSFASDNRVRGDGALFLRFAGGETAALFTRFVTQSLTTDDSTGAPTDG